MANYDIKLSFASVGLPGNEGVAIRGFVPPNLKTIPADPINPPPVGPIKLDTTSELLFNYQVVGGVPYEYDIGQFEITASQYTDFLNAVDPEGNNPKQPWTKVKLWNKKNSPLNNPFQGQILFVDYADQGQHYVLADPLWADKPAMFVNGFQYAYFINSITNGDFVGVKERVEKSSLGTDVTVSDRYFRFSDQIDSGSYALNDSNYPFFARTNNEGLFLPSQNEWIKAAYYAGRETDNSTEYFYFPTSSNKPPLPLFTQAGKDNDASEGDAAKNPHAVVDVSDTGVVNQDALNNKSRKNRGYANYDLGVFWQPWYAPDDITYSNANVTDVGGSNSPSPWLAYDMGGNLVEYTDTVAGALDIKSSKNNQKLPVGFRAHGGIANATGYQLWITATGAGDPYGQILGSAYEYGGARLAFVGDEQPQTPSGRLRKASTTDGLTGLDVVTRADSVRTFDTHYSDNLGTTISRLAEKKAGYVPMPSSFFNVPSDEGGVDYFSLTHENTSTSRIVQGKQRMRSLLETGDYNDPVKAFQALPPNQGSHDFIRYFNPKTGAYGYSDLEADAKLFESAGYQTDGVAWSV